jgi:hypothetical protein
MGLFGSSDGGGGKEFDSQEYRDKYDKLSAKYRDLAAKRLPILEQYEKNSQTQLSALIGKTAPQASKLFDQANKVNEYADANMKSALGYDTKERRAAERGKAMTDVQRASDAARQEAADRLESYGIDPSQTRAAGLDAGLQLEKTLSQVKAASDAEIGVEERGHQYVQDALAGSTSALGASSNASATGTSMLQGNVDASNQTAQLYGNMFGTPMQSLDAQGNIIGQQSALKAAEQASKTEGGGLGAALGGIGSLVGTGLGAYAGFQAGGPMGALRGAGLGQQVGGGLT